MKIFVALLSVLIFTSCLVSKKKYEKLSHDKSLLEVEKGELADSLLMVLSDNKDCRKSVKRYLMDIDKLKGDTTVMGDLYRDLTNDYVKLTKSSNTDAQNLNLQMQKVGELSQALEEKNRLLIKEEKDIDSLSLSLALREKRVQELDSILRAKDAYMLNIQRQIESALLAFEGDDLSVEVKNGNVYVSLAEELLFQSGSYDVDIKGKSALKKLAIALKDSDVMINVEGHTDDVPLRSGEVLKTNWELSVIRATSIVRILQNEGVPPQKIIASGRGEYLPKINEKTKEARATNRRTEIIISPNLDVLHELLEAR